MAISGSLTSNDELGQIHINHFVQHMGAADLDLSQMKQSEKIKLQQMLTPKMTKYIPHTPTPKQAAFLLLDARECFMAAPLVGVSPMHS